MKLLTPILLVVASSAIAQQMDMTPPKELNAIKYMLGTWTGTEKYTMGGPPETGTSTVVSSMGVGGRFVTGTHTAVSKSMKLHGMHLMTYDPQIKKYRAWWFDNMSSEAMELTGGFIGKSLVMTSKPIAIPGMEGLHSFRAAWTQTGARSLTFLLRTRQGDAPWTTAITGKYTKKR